MLADVPVAMIIVGLAAYLVLAGADFGAGFWTLAAGRGPQADEIRAFCRHAMGPVWEANHVWLIFVFVVAWTAYPVAFASIASSLAVPLFIAAVGIVLRGSAYALRGVVTAGRTLDRVFALSSMLTPFALGTVVGGIASGRVPVGNAGGDAITSWLNPTSILVGALTVAMCAYLAAVYLAADAARLDEADLVAAFRKRALASGLVGGAVALAGLLVVRTDAPHLWDGLTRGAGRAALAVSALGGVGTIALVVRRRFEPARASGALAVVAIIAGWAIAQRPFLLPGLTTAQAAADHTTLVALLVAAAFGALVLTPSLALLFGLVLRGRLDEAPPSPAPPAQPPAHPPSLPGRGVAALAVACLLSTVGFLVLAEPGWAHAVGIASLFGCVAATFVLVMAERPGPPRP